MKQPESRFDYPAIFAQIVAGKTTIQAAKDAGANVSNLRVQLIKLFGDEYRKAVLRNIAVAGEAKKKPLRPSGTVLGRMYESGITYGQIAQAYGDKCGATVYHLRQTPEYQERQRMRRERNQTIIELHGDGLSNADIAVAVGWDTRILRAFLKSIGRVPNPGKMGGASHVRRRIA